MNESTCAEQTRTNWAIHEADDEEGKSNLNKGWKKGRERARSLASRTCAKCRMFCAHARSVSFFFLLFPFCNSPHCGLIGLAPPQHHGVSCVQMHSHWFDYLKCKTLKEEKKSTEKKIGKKLIFSKDQLQRTSVKTSELFKRQFLFTKIST